METKMTNKDKVEIIDKALYTFYEELNSINAVDSTFYECCNLATTIHKLEQTKSLLSMELEIVSLNLPEEKGWGESEEN